MSRNWCPPGKKAFGYVKKRTLVHARIDLTALMSTSVNVFSGWSKSRKEAGVQIRFVCHRFVTFSAKIRQFAQATSSLHTTSLVMSANVIIRAIFGRGEGDQNVKSRGAEGRRHMLCKALFCQAAIVFLV